MLEVKTLDLVREMNNSKNLRIKVFFWHTYRASKSVKFLSDFKQKKSKWQSWVVTTIENCLPFRSIKGEYCNNF